MEPTVMQRLVAEMTLDIIGKSDVVTGKSLEVKLESVKEEMDRIPADVRKFYETYNQPDFNGRCRGRKAAPDGADKHDDIVWIGNSWAPTSRASTPRRSRRPTCNCRAATTLSCGRRPQPQRLDQHLGR